MGTLAYRDQADGDYHMLDMLTSMSLDIKCLPKVLCPGKYLSND
jgi:hypothetical protein